MICYHGSTTIVKHPDIYHSIRFLDFGTGFYVTDVKIQAERWAIRKSENTENHIGIVNVYEFNPSDKFKIMDFYEDLDHWMDFVCECRSDSDAYKQYDIIKGKVANDKVFRVVELYRRGIWDKTRAIQEFKIYETYNQIAFIHQNVIDAALSFIESYEVKS